MAETPLARIWRVVVELLTPLHVGAGGPNLLADFDYVTARGGIFVIDLDRALEQLSDDELAGRVETRLTALLRTGEYADYARYRLVQRSGEAPPEIMPCVRDVFDRPVLPGSTLKGGLRTALAWSAAASMEWELDPRRLGPNPKAAARPIEQGIFGQDPNHDLLRVLRVSDFQLDSVPEPEAELTTVSMYSLRGPRLASKGPGYRWFLECLPAGTRLVGTITLDEHLLDPSTDGLTFHENRTWLLNLTAHCAAFTGDLAASEADFYARAGLPKVAAFYENLGRTLSEAGPDEGFLQLGWGTGWTTKTLGSLLQASPSFPEVVRRYRLDRGREAGVFPKTRRLVERGNTPESPLGWVRFHLTPLRDGDPTGLGS